MFFSCALTPPGRLGGGLGWTAAEALRYGVARGVFTNEAGVGSSAMAHGPPGGPPARQGMWGIFEVFCSTLLTCTVTALVILVGACTSRRRWTVLSQLFQRQGTPPAHRGGLPLTARSFSSVLGPDRGHGSFGSLLLFAFSSILGWSPKKDDHGGLR